MRLLVFPAVEESRLAEIRTLGPSLDIVNAASEDEAREAIGEADLLYGRITPEMLAAARKLRWIQTTGAGLERYVFPQLAESDVVLTNSRGIYSDVMADHALGYILCFARGLHVYIRRQMHRRWERGSAIIHLADQTLGIIGLGGVGVALASRAAACEMRVIAVDARRTEPTEGVSALWPTGWLDDLLAESDFVAICVPHTPETERLVGAAQLRRMKPSAILINVTRGIIVDLQALTEALQAGTIAGAGLDVFEVEPLPDDHPLWGMENVIITPHRAGVSAKTGQRRWEVFTDNLRRFLAGDPLENVVDKARWF